ncbi:MAG: hypothetical protein U0359_25320 [Byssovorax sp.]
MRARTLALALPLLAGCSHPLTQDEARRLLDTQLHDKGQENCVPIGEYRGLPCDSIQRLSPIKQRGLLTEQCLDGRTRFALTSEGARLYAPRGDVQGGPTEACAHVGDFHLLAVLSPSADRPIESDFTKIRYRYEYTPTEAGRVLLAAGVSLWATPPFEAEVRARYQDGAWILSIEEPHDHGSHPLAF